jgi:hypothetical protein
VIYVIIRSGKVVSLQNTGLFDRTIRFLIGGAMLAGGIAYLNLVSEPLAQTTGIVAFIVMILSLYPLLTALVGVDPIYAAAGIRSCNDSGRNQCGTLPYQIMAILGKAPRYCETDDERSLTSCHDEHQEHPRHARWKVDQKPMLYPDDETMDEFAERERMQERKRKTGST